MGTTAVERAVATAHTFDKIDDIRIKQTVAGLQKKRSQLLGVEKTAKEQIEKELAFLARDLQRVSSFRRHGLPMLAEEVLTWRTGSKEHIPTPTFALTSLADPDTIFECRGSYHGSGTERRWFHESFSARPSIPDPFTRHYMDVIEAMRARSDAKKSNITLNTSYNGVIPDATRKKILTAKENFDEIFLLREVSEWGVVTKKVKKPPRPALLDPIVVGFDAATFWIIDTFDTTTLEQYVREEFALLSGSGLPELTKGS